jgi:hypothetical protein
VSLTTTLELMRTAVRYTADIVAFSDKHPDTRLNVLINQGLGALSRICRTTNPEFQPIASTTVTTDGVATAYALPSNFRSLISVEYDANEGTTTWLIPFELHERAAMTSDDATVAANRALAYRVLGTNIELLPRPPANHVATLWYATSVTQLASDAATFDTMERLDSYVIWWAAREIAMEREAWERYDRLSQRMGELEGEIRVLARSLDLSHPSRIVRTQLATGQDRFGRSRR